MTANQSVLDWRRAQRSLWNLADDPSPYDTCESYAQPQKMDWPVYDVENDIYVQRSAETSHLESMLELTKAECEQLRCVSIFIPRMEKERGKHRTAPHYNYKKLSITYGRWEEQLAEKR